MQNKEHSQINIASAQVYRKILTLDPNYAEKIARVLDEYTLNNGEIFVLFQLQFHKFMYMLYVAALNESIEIANKISNYDTNYVAMGIYKILKWYDISTPISEDEDFDVDFEKVIEASKRLDKLLFDEYKEEDPLLIDDIVCFLLKKIITSPKRQISYSKVFESVVKDSLKMFNS